MEGNHCRVEWLAWLLLACAALADQECGRGGAGGLHEALEVNTSEGLRRFSLLAPKAATEGKPLPVLLLTPGNQNDPHKFLKFPDLLSFAEQAPFLLVELIGENNQFNVELNSLASPERADDVAYTTAVLRHVSGKYCIDRTRVFCAGMSRGARFCVRLASELSGVIAALGIVSGLRYPQPNNATRPMPIIAFHGTADNIDPYGGGGFAYWGMASVPQELARWSNFNGCKAKNVSQLSSAVRLKRFFNCSEGADTELYTIEGAHHSWPGTAQLYGPQTSLLNVTRLMWRFLSDHPMAHEDSSAWEQLFAVPGVEDASRPPERMVVAAAAALPAAIGFLAFASRVLRRNPPAQVQVPQEVERLL